MRGGYAADMNALPNANSRRGGTEPSRAGFASGVSPEAQGSPTGVSVRYAPDPAKQWFVLRASYGRAQKARGLFEEDNVDCYLPLHHVIKTIGAKKKRVLEPLLPNFIFVYASEEYVRSLVEERRGHGYLTFYYDHFRITRFGKNPPLTIDYKSMMNFIRATSVDTEHVRVVESQYCHYKSGDMVRVVDGKFKGVEGKVARVAGQQRVVIELKGLCLIATAYIPTAFIVPLEES